MLRFFSTWLSIINFNFLHAKQSKNWTYRSACFVVVQIYQRAKISPLFSRVHKLPGELISKMDIVAASTPLPAFIRDSFVPTVAATRCHFAIATSSSYGVWYTGRCYWISERCFPTSWNRNVRVNKSLQMSLLTIILWKHNKQSLHGKKNCNIFLPKLAEPRKSNIKK